MAKICFVGDGESPRSRPQNSTRRRMDFLHLNATAAAADFTDSSSPPPPQHNARKWRIVHHIPRRCQNANNLQRNTEIERIKYGVTSVCGRRREMEDTVSVHPFFATLKNQPQIPLHFFGVFDGHGCSHVLMRCEHRMHGIVKEEIESQLGESEEWKKLMQRSFASMNEEVKEFYQHKKQRETSNITCRCELHTPHPYDIVGSTALVALVTPDKLIVSNCGDSRAVLCRKAVVVPLCRSVPNRRDELSRIAMSRAIEEVLSEPEVVVMDRTAEEDRGDEFIILASDGLWDVVSNETACEAVRMCMRAQQQHSTLSSSSSGFIGGGSDKACSDASVVLAKLAIAKHSLDNISVVVIDLRKDHRHE